MTARAGPRPEARGPDSRLSIVLGGPLYRLYLRTGLTRPPLELLRRRLLLISSIAWLPLFVLSTLEGRAGPGTATVPFAEDLEAQAHLLLALPLLIAAEPFVGRRLGPVVGHFVSSGIISPATRPRLDAAVASATRLCNSVALEAVLLLLVYTVGHDLWMRQVTHRTDTWWATGGPAGLQLSWAGWWYVYVSIPVFQFILFRWYFRLFVWSRFLWQVSRLPLRLVPTHPDRAGGLGFLGESVRGFAPVLLAQGVLVAGQIANRILHDGAPLLTFKREIAAVAVLQPLLILGPLAFFGRHLTSARRTGLAAYGIFASEYVREFEAKWIRKEVPEGTSPLGSGDIQSLADLINSFEAIRNTWPVPFGVRTVVLLVTVTVLPVAPLVLTVIPLDELVAKLLAVLL